MLHSPASRPLQMPPPLHALDALDQRHVKHCASYPPSCCCDWSYTNRYATLQQFTKPPLFLCPYLSPTYLPSFMRSYPIHPNEVADEILAETSGEDLTRDTTVTSPGTLDSEGGGGCDITNSVAREQLQSFRRAAGCSRIFK